jgi:UDP-N-acetylglucosamine 2-epimerase (non-hydrolysing)
MAPVITALRGYAPDVETRVAFTGQHTTLVDQVLGAFDVRPDYDLELMREGQSLYDVVHGALDGLRGAVRDFRPSLLLVQGDTASVFSASLVGFFERVRVGHVEAGLRSGDLSAPFPEEGLRRLTDVLSDLRFAPTAHARELLRREGVPEHTIHVTGNTVVDALLDVAGKDRPIQDERLRAVVDGAQRLVLLTAHRRESFGTPLRAVFGAVRALADSVTDIDVLYPVHPNPNVREPAHELLSDHPRIHLTAPLDYFDLVAALRAAALVLTDSGGLQEEAPTFGVPALVLREVTERPEGIAVGVAELVGTDPARILRRAQESLAAGRREPTANPYGDGRAGERIADIVVAELTGGERVTTDWNG